MLTAGHHRTRVRTARRSIVPVALALALTLALPIVAASPARAADGWILGSTKQSTILNCPSLVLGAGYTEVGVSTTVGYVGTPGVSPTVGQSSYFATKVTRLGSHCDEPRVFPRFVLPSGVSFDTSRPIVCLYTPPGPGTTIQVTHAQECPQWGSVSADGTYTSARSGWSGGWPLPSAAGWVNGSAWEFQVPFKATSPQNGSTLTTNLKVVDGNANPVLQPQVTLRIPGAPATVPSAPRSVSAAATSSTTARVTFTAPTSNGGAAITGYSTQCTSSDGGTSRTTGSTGSPVTVSGLTAGKRYACQVRAQNSAGWSPWSASSAGFVTPAAPTAPSAVTNVVATPVDLTRIRVSFTPPASTGGSPIEGYWTRCWQEGLIEHPIGQTTGSSSPVTVGGLVPGHRYFCDVVAINAAGLESRPSQVSALVRLGEPGSPAGVRATLTSPSAALVEFSAPASNGGAAITEYVARCDSSDGGTTRSVIAPTSPIAVSGLSVAKAYRCQVRARNSFGWGPWSAAAPALSPPDPGDTGDTVPPETTVRNTPVWAVSGPVVRFASPDADTARFECRVDGAAWTRCASPYRPASRPGSHVLRVRAVDAAGNADPTPASTTWTTPLDERQLRRQGKWSPGRGAAHYRGTILTSRARNASLTTRTALRARGIALVATRCRACGVVDVYYGATRLKRVSLRAAHTQRSRVINVKAWRNLRPGKRIRIVVVSRNKPVSIDGLGVRTR